MCTSLPLLDSKNKFFGITKAKNCLFIFCWLELDYSILYFSCSQFAYVYRLLKEISHYLKHNMKMKFSIPESLDPCSSSPSLFVSFIRNSYVYYTGSFGFLLFGGISTATYSFLPLITLLLYCSIAQSTDSVLLNFIIKFLLINIWNWICLTPVRFVKN